MKIQGLMRGISICLTVWIFRVFSAWIPFTDLNLQKKFWSNREDEKNTYKICMIDEDSLLKTAGVDWQKQTITDEKVRAYADMEMDYRKFVKNIILSFQKRPKKRLHRMFLKRKIIWFRLLKKLEAL